MAIDKADELKVKIDTKKDVQQINEKLAIFFKEKIDKQKEDLENEDQNMADSVDKILDDHQSDINKKMKSFLVMRCVMKSDVEQADQNESDD